MSGVLAQRRRNVEGLLRRRMVQDRRHCLDRQVRKRESGGSKNCKLLFCSPSFCENSRSLLLQDLLRIGGQYITPFSIETLLLKHPYIREAVICGVGQKESVPGNKNDSEHTVRAYVIRKEGCKLRPQDVVDFLKQEDCQVQVSPENVFFVSQIPKTTVSGRLCRYRL